MKWLSRELLFCSRSRRSERDLEACMRREVRVLSALRQVNIIRLLGWSHHMPGSNAQRSVRRWADMSNWLSYGLHRRTLP